MREYVVPPHNESLYASSDLIYKKKVGSTKVNVFS